MEIRCLCHSNWLNQKIKTWMMFLRSFRMHSNTSVNVVQKSKTSGFNHWFHAPLAYTYVCAKDTGTHKREHLVFSCLAVLIDWRNTLSYINILYFNVFSRKDVSPSKFTSKGENNVQIIAGSLSVCLAELTDFPVTAKDSAAFDLPGG